MGYTLRTVLEACLECEGQPEPKVRGVLKMRVRMECKCGVSGAWRAYTDGDPWRSALGLDMWPENFVVSFVLPKFLETVANYDRFLR